MWQSSSGVFIGYEPGTSHNLLKESYLNVSFSRTHIDGAEKQAQVVGMWNATLEVTDFAPSSRSQKCEYNMTFSIQDNFFGKVKSLNFPWDRSKSIVLANMKGRMVSLGIFLESAHITFVVTAELKKLQNNKWQNMEGVVSFNGLVGKFRAERVAVTK